MSAVSAEVFVQKGKFKKFDCLDPDQVQDELDQAECFDCPRDIWGKHQVRGIMLMAAHRLTMDLDDTAITTGQAGQLIKGQGAQGRQMQGSGYQQDELSMTTFGREFLKIRDRVVGPGMRLAN